MSRSARNCRWAIVAGGFHTKGGMDRANLALAEYLLEQEIPLHLIGHSVDPELEKHALITSHPVARPAQSFLLGEFALAIRAKSILRNIAGKYPHTRVVVNGGNCLWPGINWSHYVHHAWSGSRQGSFVYKAKAAASDQWARTTERAAYRRARVVITNSRRTTSEIVDHFGVEESRVHTVYLGSDPEWGPVSREERAASRHSLRVPESRALAIFVGGLGYDQRKGFDLLFSAWRQLCADPDWKVDLLVAGGGPAAEMWQKRIEQAGLQERIRLLGFSVQIKGILAAADLLISPVRYEAYGLNVQEAICRGIPAIVSASAGVAERYPADLKPMLLPDPEDIQALVDKLLAWRACRQEWPARFQPLSERLRAWSWRDMAVEFVAIAEEAQAIHQSQLSSVASVYN